MSQKQSPDNVFIGNSQFTRVIAFVGNVHMPVGFGIHSQDLPYITHRYKPEGTNDNILSWWIKDIT